MKALERSTGEDWEMLISEALGRGSYKEHYAFVWLTLQTKWIDGAMVYLVDADAFALEPFTARLGIIEQR